MVREENVQGLLLSVGIPCRNRNTYIARNIEAQGFELIFQPVLGNTMKFVQGEVRSLAAQRKASSMHVEHGIVQITLGIGELAIYWPSPGDIGDISSPLL